jgi:hypothetical protein
MQSLIWFLTDTNFSEEWNKSSILQKIQLLYTTFGIIACEVMSLGLIYQGITHIISKLF